MKFMILYKMLKIDYQAIFLKNQDIGMVNLRIFKSYFSLFLMPESKMLDET